MTKVYTPWPGRSMTYVGDSNVCCYFNWLV